MDQEALNNLKNNGESFFLPYYLEVVAKYPTGVLATRVKAEVAEIVARRCGFDPFHPDITPPHPATGKPAASQWANNLVSNRVLDKYVNVLRGRRAILSPKVKLSPSTITTPTSVHKQVVITTVQKTVTTFQRSRDLVNYVKTQSEYKCTCLGDACSLFKARDGQPYVEVHHILPMSLQFQTNKNLDSFENLVSLCSACHTKLHFGSVDVVRDVTTRMLDGYSTQRGVPWGSTDYDIADSLEDLVSYYTR